MGWWWSSSPTAASPAEPVAAPAPPNTQDTPQHSSLSTSSSIPPQAHITPQEQADRDLEALIASLDSNSPPPAPSTPSDLSSPNNATTPSPQAPLDISPRALYPRTMSCRQAFDSAFYCQSVGGKFNDIYRHGSVQSCSEHWSAFWFCMKTKNWDDKTRERAIAEWYEERETRVREARGGGSSEDVWELRRTPVREAFARDPDAVAAAAGEGQVV